MIKVSPRLSSIWRISIWRIWWQWQNQQKITNQNTVSLSWVLCLFRQVEASNDASLLYHELFSLYVHIPHRCSSSSLSSYHSASHEFFSHPFCLLRLYTEGSHFSTPDLTNFSVFVGRCSSSFCFHSSCPKPLDWIHSIPCHLLCKFNMDRCSVQLIFINFLQIHISNDSSHWMSTIVLTDKGQTRYQWHHYCHISIFSKCDLVTLKHLHTIACEGNYH